MAYLGRALTAGNYLKLDDLSSQFNGTQKTFNLTSGGQAFYPGSAFSILVSLGGVIQEPESAYQINQSQITFAVAPQVSDDFFCIALGVALGVGVPADGTVSGEKLKKPFSYDGGLLYLDDANNRVGINSTVPGYTFDVNGDTRIVGILTVGTSSLTLNGATNQINDVTISSGIVTATSIVATTGTFTGNVSIGGTLTYEDVTNIDSVGIITARSGVRVNSGGLVVTSGVSTFTNLVVSAGSTSAPAIIPSGNSNTGVFFPSTNTFAVATNGTEKIKVSAGGTFAFGGNAGSGISTNRTYHFYAPGTLIDEQISYYFESGAQAVSISGRQYGIYISQGGARYTNQTGLYATHSNTIGNYANNYRGVHGVTFFETQAGGSTEAIFGETTIPNWNYQARHCAVRGVAQGGSTTFSNTYGLGPSNGAFGGHFVAYGKADVCGVYADAYQTASPGAGTQAVPLMVATNGTELLRVTTTGNVNIANGNLVFSTAGKGIDFSATSDGSGTMSSELLADYEEGSWTPRISGTGSGDYTPGVNNVGRYVKVGKIVTVSATINWTAAVTPYSGNFIVSGLPYAALSVGNYRAAGSIPGQIVGVYASGSYNMLKAGIDGSNSFVYIVMASETITSGANYSHNPTVLSSGTLYGFTITYVTN